MRKNIFTAETRRGGDFQSVLCVCETIYFLPAFLRLGGLILILSAFSFAQKIAILAPEKTTPSENFIEKLEAAFPETVKVLDDALGDAAYRSQSFDNPFNLTLAQAKNVGTAIGCDFFLLIKTDDIKRSSAARGNFYESFAAIFVVSARTGRLVFFTVESRESNVHKDAQARLFDSAKFLAPEIFERIKIARAAEFNEKSPPNFEPLPEENSPEAKNFRAPLPYKRLSPVYTRLANSYAVEATVDAEIDVDENGKIQNIQIARWAGFGLDESVAENIRRMNWRAATRNEKPLSTRVLLRYNFKKTETGN